MPKTELLNFDHLIFGFVSNFEIRISDLLGKTPSSAISISQDN